MYDGLDPQKRKLEPHEEPWVMFPHLCCPPKSGQVVRPGHLPHYSALIDELEAISIWYLESEAHLAEWRRMKRAYNKFYATGVATTKSLQSLSDSESDESTYQIPEVTSTMLEMGMTDSQIRRRRLAKAMENY